MVNKTFWIQETKMKRGALSKQLGIPENQNIPFTLLQKIKDAKVGSTIMNPTLRGKSEIKVTKLLKKRAVLALTLKRM